jgi:arylsulfatase
MAIRVRDWKIAFMEQHTEINPKTPIGVWQGNFTKLRAPNLYNLRADPFERGTESLSYGDWQMRLVFLMVPAQALVAKYIDSFKDFPPRAKAASFTVGDVMEKIQSVGNKN